VGRFRRSHDAADVDPDDDIDYDSSYEGEDEPAEVPGIVDFDDNSVFTTPAMPPEVRRKNPGTKEMTTEQLRRRFLEQERDDPGFLRSKIPVLSGSPTEESILSPVTDPNPLIKQFPWSLLPKITKEVVDDVDLGILRSCYDGGTILHFIFLLIAGILILVGRLAQFPCLLLEMATTGLMCLSSIFFHSLFQGWKSFF
jgi:hypothetical protein